MKTYEVTVTYNTDGWGFSRFYESNIEAISKVDALGRAVNNIVDRDNDRVIEFNNIRVVRLRSSQTSQLDELVDEMAGPEDFDEDITTTSGRTSSGILYNKTTALTYQTYKFVVKWFHDHSAAEVYTDQIVIHDCYSQFQAEAKLVAQMKHTNAEPHWWIDTVEVLEDTRINK